ncbi:MAG: sugar ABC transporter permease [Chloroflexi bacterium]|nr:sugar ABC transporter permease [Chloroflexota bacterium]MCY3937540.1 sugar ABC transporter permease [Chloroflexota bacterium]
MPVALFIFAYFGLFFAVPFAIAIAIGLFNWDLLSAAVFVGADNFLKMFKDKLFLNGLKVSFLFVGIEVPLILALEMLLAVLLSKLGRFSQKVYLTMIFLPVITPWLVVVMMWGFLFYPKVGLLPGFGQLVGLDLTSPLVSRDTALYAFIVMTIWKFVGFGAVIFLVGINEVPAVQYEAAIIDGAGGWAQFWHITLPLIRPILLGMSITGFIGALQIFEPFFIMTRGGPGDATRTFSLYLYQQAFEQLRFGYASAMALFMFLLLLGISILQLVVVRTRWEY